MLVLLIIFMVVSPLATVDLKIDLPAATAQARPMPRSGAVRVAESRPQPVSGRGAGGARAARSRGWTALPEGDRQRTVFFQADKQAAYEDVLAVMDGLRQAGYLKVGLVGREGGVISRSHQERPVLSWGIARRW